MPRRIALLAVFTPFLLGQMCGAPGPVPEPSYGRLDVTPTLRTACSSYGADDAEIDNLISLMEADRLNGLSWNAMIQVVSTSCQGDGSMPEWSMGCTQCGVAIADQIYGR